MEADAAGPATFRPALTRHRLPEHAFDALAAGTDALDVVAALRATERSHRAVLLRAILDAARRAPSTSGPLPPVDAAWDLLVHAERRDPGQVACVLHQPQIGTWAGHTLRRMRGRRHDDVPLWVDLGYLHSLAAAAAIRAGIPFRIAVPVRHGVTMLPSLGCARLPSNEAWETAEVRAEHTSIQVIGRRGVVGLHADQVNGSPSWRRVTLLRAECAGDTLRVALDDTDPYRNIVRPARPTPLPPPTVRRWERTLHDAWSLLVGQDPGQARAIATGISVIVPLPRAAAFRERSASSGAAFGGLVLSEPRDATQLAVTLVHEFQHTILGALMHLVDLFEDGCTELFYAPWRSDPRPLPGLFQGIFAFFGVAGFWRGRRHATVAGEAELAHFEFALWRQQVWRTLLALRARPELTVLGRRFLDGVGSTLEAWQSEPVARHLVARADAAAADHRAGWRIRHLRPPEDLVCSLARAWSAREATGAAAGVGLGTDISPSRISPSRLHADPSAQWLDTRAVLNRLWLADRDAFRRLERSSSPGREVAGATPADLAYVAGRHATARELYLADLAEGPDRFDAWVGLGLTLAAAGQQSAARTLLDHPHVVRAVSRVVAERTGRPPAPVELAAWLGGMPTDLD